jgi:hypothetical protein
LLLTAMLVNRHQSGEKSDDSKILFQSEVVIAVSDALEPLNGEGDGPPAGGEGHFLEDEDEDLAFIYRESEPLAHGHGISVDWSEDRKRVWTLAVPMSLVHGLRSDPGRFKGMDLTIESLTGLKKAATLEGIVSAYADWVNELSGRVTAAFKGSRHEGAAQRVFERQSACVARITQGCNLVTSDPEVEAAWSFALRSMAAQFERPASKMASPGDAPSLRPFQVAYALLVLPGLGERGAADASREIVDLLWFPTGGGKTEAYLLVVLLEAFLRRIQHPDDNGCVALSRYTYRMLALDQFSRASSAVCAAELVRRGSAEILGSEPFRVGLWIGMSQTPNNLRDVDSAYKDDLPWRQRWMASDPSFPLVACPWCGTTLKFSTDYLAVNPDNNEFVLWCPNENVCSFSDQKGTGLPIAVIDEHIYSSLPTIIVATADKLAQLPVWSAHEGPRLLRGHGTAKPISLLIFDELHLLSGPLGTLASLYEIAVEAIISSEGQSTPRPKIIASTATIRTAGNQATGLLGRKLETFPAAGDSPDDSFWAIRDDRPETARLYLGAMTSGSTWQALYVYAQTSIFRSVTSLPPEQRNPYWTSVVYAGTLRDHGRAVGLLANDVRNRLTEFDDAETREIEQIEELRGDRVGSQLPQILARLKVDYRERDNVALDAVVTTNLIQVGVDVQRLGLMVLLGQPKGTAEYIQATSRVGRSAASSGLIFTLFQHTRPRDRSHYELFKSYHEALYRSVEPISVTPLAEPALERCIRAVFAAVARHGGPADLIDVDAKTVGAQRAWLERAAERVRGALMARDDGLLVSEQLDSLLGRLVDGWHARAMKNEPLLWADRASNLPHFPLLLAPRFPPKTGPEWPYDFSLRNVEASVKIPIRSVVQKRGASNAADE